MKILMYHRVAELTPDTHQLCLPPAQFRAQLERLARTLHPMPLDELIRSQDPRAVAVTLDDGTLDSLVAAELLDRVGVPATFFLGGHRLDEPHESWWDTLERVFLTDAPLPERFEDLPTATAGERRAAHQTLRARIFPMGAEQQSQAMAQLAIWSGLELSPRDSHRLLISAEIAALAARHTIGAHGLHHLHLPSLPPADQRRELSQSRANLETLLGRPVTQLAYAYGACDDNLVALARELGFTLAVTTADREVTPEDDPLRLPRQDARSGVDQSW